jgi:hypothetical protein
MDLAAERSFPFSGAATACHRVTGWNPRPSAGEKSARSRAGRSLSGLTGKDRATRDAAIGSHTAFAFPGDLAPAGGSAVRFE